MRPRFVSLENSYHGETMGALAVGDVKLYKEIYDEIDTLEKSEIKANKYVKKHYFYQYPLGAAIVVMFLYIFARGRRYAA